LNKNKKLYTVALMPNVSSNTRQ